MKKLVLLVVIAFISVAVLPAQPQPVCGTSGPRATPLLNRLLANRAQPPGNQVTTRDVQYVPVKFHLVARNDGTGRIAESKVLDQLCVLNEDFLEMSIQFFIKEGFDYLNNTAVYENHAATENSIMAIRKDRKALNIWVVENATPAGSEPGDGIVYGYYSIDRDWLVVRLDQINANTKVLTHEVGHFFSLLHPHNGWDGEPWSLEIHGNPAPALSPEGIPTELMDGSNCTVAGDFVCDTPPDYNGLGWPNCDYTKGAQDPNGIAIDPDETNFMSYFLFCDRGSNNFTTEQKALMITDLGAVWRNYLRQYAPTNTAAITAAPQLQLPVNNQEVSGGGNILLQWTAVENADSYVVEIDRTPAFSVSPIFLIATTNSLEVSGLAIDRRYFWRVRPYNEYSTCMEATGAQSFTVVLATAVNTIDFVNGWSLSPNPARGGRKLNLEINTEVSFEGELNLFSVTGQRVSTLGSRRFAAGTNRLSIPTDGLSAGVYLFTLVTDAGRLSQRVVITG